MSRRPQQTISLPCGPECAQHFYRREQVMAELHVGKSQYYRLIERGLKRCRNGLVRCDWLRGFLESRGTNATHLGRKRRQR